MGLISKPYTFSDTPANTNIIDADEVNANFDEIYDEFNGGITAANLDSSLTSALGTGGRGVTVVSTEQARTNTAYGTLTTPDSVSGVTLPTNGLLFIAYQATWKESVAGAARAAIFLGANQAKIPVLSSVSGAPVEQETRLSTSGGANTYVTLFSYPNGLMSQEAPVNAYTGNVTTGQIIGRGNNPDVTEEPYNHGGVCAVFAAAGTYTVSVQFKATSGTVTAKNRNLWVWTLGF